MDKKDVNKERNKERNNKQSETQLNNTETKKQSYAEVTKDDLQKQEATIKSFIKSVNKEERWLKSTKCNIMVHDLGENKHENEEQQRVGDKDFIERILKAQMGFDVTIIKVERIGALKMKCIQMNDGDH